MVIAAIGRSKHGRYSVVAVVAVVIVVVVVVVIIDPTSLFTLFGILFFTPFY